MSSMGDVGELAAVLVSRAIDQHKFLPLHPVMEPAHAAFREDGQRVMEA
jgi:hypothetical protein